jgi:hypothetical protein
VKVSQLKTLLKRYGFDDEDPLMEWLNAAYHEIENAYEKWSWLEASEIGTIAEGGTDDGRFTLTRSVRRFIKVRDVTDETALGGEGLDLKYMDFRAMQREFPNLRTKGNPEYFTILGTDTIQVYPVPGAARDIETSYIFELPDLSTDEEEPLVPVADHYTIVRGAAYVALEAENEEERAATAQAQFESALEKMVTNDSIRQVGEPGEVQDVMEYAD